MGTKGNYTSSGSKSLDTRGSEPSQDDVREKLRTGLSGDSAGEESLDSGGEAGLGSTGVRGQRGTPGRDRHL